MNARLVQKRKSKRNAMRQTNLRQDMYVQATISKTRCDTNPLGHTLKYMFEAIQATHTHTQIKRKKTTKKRTYLYESKVQKETKATKAQNLHIYTKQTNKSRYI